MTTPSAIQSVPLGYETILDDRVAFTRENVARLQEAADARLFAKQRGAGSLWCVMYLAMTLPSRPYTWHDAFALLPIAALIAVAYAKSQLSGSPRLAQLVLAEPTIVLVPAVVALFLNRPPVEAGVFGFAIVVATVCITLWAWTRHYENWKRMSVVSVDPAFDRCTEALTELMQTPSELNRARVIQLRVGNRFRHWSQLMREGELIVFGTKGGPRPLQFALPENVAIIDRHPSGNRFYFAGTLVWDDERLRVLIDEPNLTRFDAAIASTRVETVNWPEAGAAMTHRFPSSIFALAIVGLHSTAFAAEPQPLKPAAVTASAAESKAAGGHADYPPEKTIDGDMKPASSWRTEITDPKEGQWILYDLGESKSVASVRLAFVKGNERVYRFTLELSADGKSFDGPPAYASAGKTADFETFALPKPIEARYVRVRGLGNSSEQFGKWINIIETQIIPATRP